MTMMNDAGRSSVRDGNGSTRALPPRHLRHTRQGNIVTHGSVYVADEHHRTNENTRADQHTTWLLPAKIARVLRTTVAFLKRPFL